MTSSRARAPHRRALLLALAPLSLAACGDSTTAGETPGRTNMTVALRAEVPAGTARIGANGLVSASVAPGAAGPIVVTGTANDTLVITSVKVVLKNVRLRRAGVEECVDSIAPAGTDREASERSGCARLDLGPMLVDVPLSAGDTAALSAKVPAGSYRGAKFLLHRLRLGREATAQDSALVTANPEMLGASVRVAGTYRDTAFVFYSRASAEIKFLFEPPLVISADSPDNITVNLRPTLWFKGQNGGILSPLGDRNRSAINNAIHRSFEAFGDRSRRGRGDDANRPRRDGESKETEPESSSN